MAITKEQLGRIREIFSVYDREFLGKSFEYHYKGRGIKKATRTVRFGKEHFMHLCGVESYSNDPKYTNAKEFYKAVQTNRVDRRRCRISNYIDVKLGVLTSLGYLKSCEVGFSTCGHTASIKYDAAVKKHQLFLTFVESNGSSELVPYSVINASKTNKGEYNAPYIVTKLVIYENGRIVENIVNQGKNKKNLKKRKNKELQK